MVIYKVTAKKDGEEFYRDYYKRAKQARDAADLAGRVPGATAEWCTVSEYEPEYSEGIEIINAKKGADRHAKKIRKTPW